MEIIILIWLALLSLLMIYSASIVIKLFSIKNRGLRQSIYDSLEASKKNSQEISALKSSLGEHESQSQNHFHKTALVRFNPFERMGGEQSHSLALLNDKNNGVVLTFLYTKEGVRTYVKEVLSGKGKEVELSKEEKEAIDLANQTKVKN